MITEQLNLIGLLFFVPSSAGFHTHTTSKQKPSPKGQHSPSTRLPKPSESLKTTPNTPASYTLSESSAIFRQSSGNESPSAAADFGSRDVSVIPGIVFASST